MINQIYQGLKRLLFGNTYKFTNRKGSCSLSGSSWVEIYSEMTKTPLKLISINFLMENKISAEYRIVVTGEKIFPFSDFSPIENDITRNFLMPIEIAAGSFLQIEVRSDIKNKNVIIMDELAIIVVE